MYAFSSFLNNRIFVFFRSFYRTLSSINQDYFIIHITLHYSFTTWKSKVLVFNYGIFYQFYSFICSTFTNPIVLTYMEVWYSLRYSKSISKCSSKLSLFLLTPFDFLRPSAFLFPQNINHLCKCSLPYSC
ncbi:hypothetical protein OTUT144_0009 [Orientia tsutsugamushi str. UT144]|uniref:Uncharacterized protein n=1 Tax=Orientia tsutsugamushi str. UT144 TaxID=1441384 RepID=A0A0F3RNZ8_ORITS|nr:hypothetical protein OTUT144_0009 [Orientia tsutsugamushi str. UT144]